MEAEGQSVLLDWGWFLIMRLRRSHDFFHHLFAESQRIPFLKWQRVKAGEGSREREVGKLMLLMVLLLKHQIEMLGHKKVVLIYIYSLQTLQPSTCVGTQLRTLSQHLCVLKSNTWDVIVIFFMQNLMQFSSQCTNSVRVATIIIG